MILKANIIGCYTYVPEPLPWASDVFNKCDVGGLLLSNEKCHATD